MAKITTLCTNYADMVAHLNSVVLIILNVATSPLLLKSMDVHWHYNKNFYEHTFPVEF